MLKKVILGILFITLTSCSQTTLKQQKLSSYENHKTLPHFEVSKDLVEKAVEKTKNQNRQTASVSSPQKDELSSKDVYFVSVYEQYQTLGQFYPQYYKELKSCPHFHNLKIENQRAQFVKMSPKAEEVYSHAKEEQSASKYPELNLTDEHSQPLKNIIGQTNEEEFVQKFELAHKNYLERNYQELVDLCEYGYSSNYYIYENLKRHLAQNKSNSKLVSLVAISKTLVFSNLLVIASHEKRVFGPQFNVAQSLSGTQKEALRRIDSSWTIEYLQSKLVN